MSTERTLAIPSELYERIERLAVVRQESVAYVLEEALALVEAQPIELVRTDAMSRQEAAYRAMYSELFEKYAGQYVAMHGGKLVDVDGDELALAARVNARFPGEVVLLKQVQKSPMREVNYRSVDESAAMRKEEADYRAMHGELFKRYAGQYVAVFKGELVDSDADELALYRRIDEHYPHDVVLMKRVEKSPEKVYHFRSSRLIREG